jgi:hypothetical protein
MMSTRVLGAAVIVASAVSSPALAQAVFSNPAACESQFQRRRWTPAYLPVDHLLSRQRIQAARRAACFLVCR